MKRINISVFVMLGVLCLAFSACTKEETCPYSDSVWTGEYPIETQNGTTGVMVEMTGTISLNFQNGGMDCIVEKGIAGLYSVNWIKYETRWATKNSFTLYESYGGRYPHISYSGTIRGGIMTLEMLSFDSVVATYELSCLRIIY